MAGKEDDIERYRKGQLSPKERNALEKKALNDPFLEDALEGSHTISPEEFSSDLTELAKKIEGKSYRSWLTPLRIAAGIMILIGAGSLFFWIDLSQPATLALEKSSAVIADSVVNEKKEDSTRSLLSLDKSEQEPPISDQADQKPSEKKLKPSIRKAKVSASDLSTTTGAGSKTAEAEIAKEDSPVVEEIKVAETPIVEAAPTVAMKEESRKESDVLSRSKMKRAASPTISDSRSSGLVSDGQTISGKVVSSEDGSPMPGVNVVVKGTTTGTVTDANGKFQISTDQANPQLTFSFIGFSTVEAKPEQGSTLNVEMKDDVSQLSEVVVTGYGASSDDKAREPVIKSAYPTGGLRAYNKYLEDNLRYPSEALESNIKGKVTVEFTISTNGNLSEFNVLKGLGHGCDEEVIRLVKEGPKWNPTTVDKAPVETQVRVKMKFDPAKAKK